MYYISWEGYGQEHNQWMKAEEMQCSKKIKEFWQNRRIKERGRRGKGGKEERRKGERVLPERKSKAHEGKKKDEERRTEEPLRRPGPLTKNRIKEDEVLDLTYEDSESEEEDTCLPKYLF